MLPLVQDKKAGLNHTLRVLDSLGSSLLLTEGLKTLAQEERPDGTGHDSFPSGHATAAFAVATMQSAYHPKEAPFWYAGAALIGASRTTLHRHFERDVLAGGLIGFGMAKLELSTPRGLLLSPIILPGNRVGLNLTAFLR